MRIGRRSVTLALFEVMQGTVRGGQVESGGVQCLEEDQRVWGRDALPKGVVRAEKEPVYDLRHTDLGALLNKFALKSPERNPHRSAFLLAHNANASSRRSMRCRSSLRSMALSPIDIAARAARTLTWGLGSCMASASTRAPWSRKPLSSAWARSAASERKRSRVGAKLVVVHPAIERGATDIGQPGTLSHRRGGGQIRKCCELFCRSDRFQFLKNVSHSVSFCLILSHSVSFCLILSHSVSFCLILSHSVSLSYGFLLAAGQRSKENETARWVCPMTQL